MSPTFRQVRGVRQSCSLSPAVFILVLNRADACWLGYADDLVIMSTSERGVHQQALMQLQAACAFVGLQIYVAKTKCMVQRAEAQREHLIVQWDDSRYEGCVVDWEARSVVINEEQERCLNTYDLGAVQPTHLLLYDDGELTPVVVKAGGGLRDGDALRVTKLGHREYVDQKNTHRYDACGQVLWTMQALHSHTASQGEGGTAERGDPRCDPSETGGCGWHSC